MLQASKNRVSCLLFRHSRAFFFKYVDQYALAKVLEEDGELFILERGVINHTGDFARAIKEQHHQAYLRVYTNICQTDEVDEDGNCINY